MRTVGLGVYFPTQKNNLDLASKQKQEYNKTNKPHLGQTVPHVEDDILYTVEYSSSIGFMKLYNQNRTTQAVRPTPLLRTRAPFLWEYGMLG